MSDAPAGRDRGETLDLLNSIADAARLERQPNAQSEPIWQFGMTASRVKPEDAVIVLANETDRRRLYTGMVLARIGVNGGQVGKYPAVVVPADQLDTVNPATVQAARDRLDAHTISSSLLDKMNKVAEAAKLRPIADDPAPPVWEPNKGHGRTSDANVRIYLADAIDQAKLLTALVSSNIPAEPAFKGGEPLVMLRSRHFHTVDGASAAKAVETAAALAVKYPSQPGGPAPDDPFPNGPSGKPGRRFQPPRP